MKLFFLTLILQLTWVSYLSAQNHLDNEIARTEIYALIDKYSEARENRDSVLLKNILTEDVDQLVSSGEWRTGIAKAIEGMQWSSATNEGKRTLKVEKFRMLSPDVSIVDARYQIENKDGTIRKMWSTFVLVRVQDQWKISGIRNMLPTNQ